jgi:hypothetical protein
MILLFLRMCFKFMQLSLAEVAQAVIPAEAVLVMAQAAVLGVVLPQELLM